MMELFNPMQFDQTPYIFFTGKGGVGKTSTASATAISLANANKKVLLVSTDPASNLQDVFEMNLTNEPKPVDGLPLLSVCNLDPEVAAQQYKEKVVGPYREKLPKSVLDQMEEQLSGACTVEIAAFDEFTNLLANEQITKEFDHILFDTAPTGHTLRLLQLPTAWSGFLEDATHGASCLGPLSGLEEKKSLYAGTVDVLSDSEKTQLVLITRPDTSTFLEAERASKELKEIGIKNQLLVINGVFENNYEDDTIADAYVKRQKEAMDKFNGPLTEIPTYKIPFVPFSLTGIDSFSALFIEGTYDSADFETAQIEESRLMNLQELVNDFYVNNKRVILTMGKGGVGKTTIASAIAVGLAEKGQKVHLTTTDPAAHIEYTLNSEVKDNLSISKIDPEAEVEAYRKEVLGNAKVNMSEEEIAYLEEDLNSPCTEEIAVFHAFAEVVDRADEEVIIIDTAPTGHTLLLLDATESYHKELEKSKGKVPDCVRTLLPRLRNPKETSVVIVTLPEATPYAEAKRLQEELIRASITPDRWIVNQSLYATGTTNPVLISKSKEEKHWVGKVQEASVEIPVIVPWQTEERIGYDEIRSLLLV
ncbi:arsenical pump-driving ATPase [Terribacillus saccharophilus]|uniref:arsenical pump-driving ATPase n=1 Tax=Terribacillus saccharophilus TaxID=361277 RepID=UPI0038185644